MARTRPYWLAAMAAVTAIGVFAISAPGAVAAGTSYTWIGSAFSSGGDNHSWTDANNWSPSGVPGTGDSVSIDSPDASHCTAHVDNVPTVTLAGFSLSQNPNRCGVSVNGGDLTVTDAFSWNGGTLNSPTHIASGASGALSGSNGRLNVLSQNLDVAGSLGLSGVVQDGGSNTGGFRITAPDVLHVESGGTLTSSGPNAVGFSACCVSPAKIINDGTIEVNGGDFTVDAVEVDQNGTLAASSGGRLVTEGAPLTAANGASYTGSGGWLIEDGASAKLSGTQNVGNGFHLELGGLNVNAGAQLGGTATLAGTGVLDWTGGTIEGNLTIAHGLTVRALGSHTDNGKRFLSGRDGLSSNVPSTLTNHGTMNFGNGATVLTGNQAKLVNAANGTLSLAPGTQTSPLGCCTNPDQIVNNGSVVVPTGAATSPVVLDGIAYKATGGSTSIAPGRTLELAGGARGSLASTAVSGGGKLADADPTTVSGAITVGTNTKLGLQPSGSMDGTATIGGAGSLPWTGGSFSGNVTVTAGGGVAVSGPRTKALANVGGGSVPSRLTLKSPTTIAAGTSAHHDLVDLGSSKLTLESRTSAGNNVDLSHGKLVNAGSLTVHPGTVHVTGDLSQTAGLINVLAGAHLNLETTSRAISLGGGVIEGAGTIGGSVTNTGGTVKPAGPSTGTLHLAGAYTQGTKGTLALDMAAHSRDLLAVGGPASLRGRVTAHNVGGYVPAMGTKVRGLTSTGLTDALGCATTSGGGATSGHWAQSNDPANLYLTWRAGAHTGC